MEIELANQFINGRYLVSKEEPRKGAFAEVYKAYDQETGRHVALKKFFTDVKNPNTHDLTKKSFNK